MPTYIRDSGVWKPVSGGTTGDNTPVANVPTGAVFHFAASTPPTGYLKANGDTVPNGTGTVQGISANFSTLYAILGSTYGSAGKLPDLRGEFVRGWDDARGVDSGRLFGTAQEDAFKSHTHTIATRASVQSGGAEEPPLDASGGAVAYPTSSTGGTETRPRNIALLACIKY
jgi:phage-related tail fiber protein